MKWFYEFVYRYFQAPWDIGPREELVKLVSEDEIKPCRVIDLGSGTASNCIFLAKYGFDVTGIDYSPAAIKKGRRMAKEAGLKIDFIVDDLTNIQNVKGPFDFLVDYGTFDDLILPDRDLYIKNILPLTRPGSLFLMYCFEWYNRWWDIIIKRIKIFGAMNVEPGEIERRFGEYFTIKRIKEKTNDSKMMPRIVVYLMKRR